MLMTKDTGEKTNGRLAAALSRWEPEGRGVRFDSSTGAGVTQIRLLLEASGRGGTVRTIRIDGTTAFVYLCFTPRGELFAQGIGDSPELAILDAFLQCTERMGSLLIRKVDRAETP